MTAHDQVIADLALMSDVVVGKNQIMVSQTGNQLFTGSAVYCGELRKMLHIISKR